MRNVSRYQRVNKKRQMDGQTIQWSKEGQRWENDKQSTTQKTRDWVTVNTLEMMVNSKGEKKPDPAPLLTPDVLAFFCLLSCSVFMSVFWTLFCPCGTVSSRWHCGTFHSILFILVYGWLQLFDKFWIWVKDLTTYIQTDTLCI